MFDGKVRNQARVGIASASDEDAVDMNVLRKSSAMMTSECKVALINPFMQGQAGECRGVARGLDDIVFIDEGGSEVRVIERLDCNKTLSIGRRQVYVAKTKGHNA